MLIRNALESDVPVIGELYEKMYDTLRDCGFPYALDAEALADVLKTLCKSRLCCLLAAEDESRIVGFISAALLRLDRKLKNEDSAPVGIINDVFVLPELRGRGIASALCDAAEDWMRESGAKTVRAEVVSGNTGAFGFWKKRGCSDLYTVVSRGL